MPLFRVIGFLAFALAGLGAAAQPPDSIDRDYRKELPRLAPLEPEQALASFQTAAGFCIELAASEPLVVDPVAMAFDEDGRLFVAEMRGYSEDDAARLGRIRVLTDQDGDGRFDQDQVLVDGLSWPTAVICYDGGVFVGAAPTIDYWKDTDGDGRADFHQVIYEGFGKSNVQGLLNSLTWRLDNRIQVAVSSSGAELHRVGAPDAPLTLRGRDFSFDPHTLTFRAESGGGQHGLSFNRWGVEFVCSNSDHIQQILLEDRYAARNPYQTPPPARISIAVDGPQADVFRLSPVEPWRIVRTRLRRQQLVPGPLERGGLAAGYFTGATGVTLYTGDNWPPRCLDWAVVGDVGSNLVHRKRLQLEGERYRAERIDQQSEWLRSSDNWFRPVQFANGPDGCLYIADMYREVIEHPASLPPVIKKHLDLTSGRDRGRIYRMRWSAAARRSPEAMSQLSSAQLVARLTHPNDWTRATAARLLVQRGAVEQVAAVEQRVLDEQALPEGRLRAAYVLASWGILDGNVVLPLLHSPHPWLREHAVRLAEQTTTHAGVRAALLGMTTDPDVRVRIQLAYTLGELQGPQRLEALAQLAAAARLDSPVRAAVLTSLASGAGALLRMAVDQEDPAGLSPEGARDEQQTAARLAWIRILAAQIGKQQRADDVAVVLQVLQAGAAAQTPAWKAVLEGLQLMEQDPLRQQIAAATQGQADQALRALGVEAAQQALDESRALDLRGQAVGRLQLAPPPQQREVAQQLLGAAQPVLLQLAALDLLNRQSDPAVADIILRAWSSFSPMVRQRAAEILFTRDAWLNRLLDAVSQGELPISDIDSPRAALLRAHPDAEIRKRAEQLLEHVNADRRQVVEQYQPAISMEGDIERGRLAFKKHCASCHQLEGVGYPIGPNLAAMRNRGAETILNNVLDPNREVNPQYLNFLLRTRDGKALSGMIAQETATSIALLRADNQGDSVLRVDIEELQSSGVSLMPEGLEKQINVQAMADLLAFLLQTS